METIHNKRRFFRIVDLTDLSYRVIDAKDVAEHSYVTERIANPGSLAQALASIREDADKLQARIDKHQPEIGQYLKLLDEKIELLVQAIVPADANDNAIGAEINLSASGIAFPAREALAPGAILELTLLLAPLRVVLVVCGRVIQCRDHSDPDKGDTPYWIGADFINLTDANRDLLQQHLVKRQMRQIREQKRG